MKPLFTFLLAAVFCVTQAQVTINYSGNLDSLEIPVCVDSILIEVWGAQGEGLSSGGSGGMGGYASGKLDVTEGDKIYINVGGTNGYNGGGIGGVNGYTGGTTQHPDSGGNGGGATDIRFGGKTLGDRIIIAGGGGGAGHDGVWPSCQPAPGANGGSGGANAGTTGQGFSCNCTGGGGTGGGAGTNVAGGMGGVYGTGNCGTVSGGHTAVGGNGSLGQGGNGATTFYNGTGGGGGGGGGHHGGGAGASGWDTTPGGGGGGGSSYTGGVDNTSTTPGIRAGNGQAIITYLGAPGPNITVNVAANVITSNQNGATYQWLDCGNAYAIIPGETGQSFTATANGDYAVEITLPCGADTSACETIVGVGIESIARDGVKLYPNPVKEVLQLDVDQKGIFFVKISDLQGRTVLKRRITNGHSELYVNELEAGTYFVEVSQNDRVVLSQKMVKL